MIFILSKLFHIIIRLGFAGANDVQAFAVRN